MENYFVKNSQSEIFRILTNTDINVILNVFNLFGEMKLITDETELNDIHNDDDRDDIVDLGVINMSC